LEFFGEESKLSKNIKIDLDYSLKNGELHLWAGELHLWGRY